METETKLIRWAEMVLSEIDRERRRGATLDNIDADECAWGVKCWPEDAHGEVMNIVYGMGAT